MRTATACKRSLSGRNVWGALGLVVASLAADGLFPADNPSAAFTILYTNDTEGYLQTCGCNHSGLGGFDRRATFIKQVRAEQPDVLLLDSGNLAPNAPKADMGARLMALLGYDAVGIGREDLGLGDRFFRIAEAWNLPLVGCEIGGQPQSKSVQPYRSYALNGYHVSVVGLPATDPPQNVPELLMEVRPVLEQVRTRSDFVVALSQLGPASDEAVAGGCETAGLIDLIIGNREAAEWKNPKVVGQTVLVPTSQRGQHVGRVDVHFVDGQPHLTHRLVPLDATVRPDPAMVRLLEDYYAGVTQALLDASLVEPKAGPEKGDLDVERAVEKWYAPADQCATCHRREYTIWQQQKHARAVADLSQKRRLVPECLPCHSELYRRSRQFMPTGGPRTECSALPVTATASCTPPWETLNQSFGVGAKPSAGVATTPTMTRISTTRKP